MKKFCETICAILVILIIVSIPFGHIITWAWKVGIPRDRDVLEVSFDTVSSSNVNVYGSSFKTDTDEFGNQIIIVDDCYEAKFWGWRYTGEQKVFLSLYGIENGLYILKVFTDSGSGTNKILIIK